MNDKHDKSVDVNINIAGTEVVPKTTMKLVEKLLGPFTEQFGYFIRDIGKFVEYEFWKNINSIIGYTKDMPDNNLYTNPRMFFSIIEKGRWIDNEQIQKMWAGLLVSSRSIDGKDDSNLIFINILSQLNSSEVKILDYICNNTKKLLSRDGLVMAEKIDISIENLLKISGISDIHRLDLELDHLRMLELTNRAGFIATTDPYQDKKKSIGIAPSGLALHLYVRCKGSLQLPIDYFQLK